MSPVIEADAATRRTLRRRWKSGTHVGEARPVCRAYVRTGRMTRAYRHVSASDVFAVIPGVSGGRIWQGKWVAKNDYVPLPNLKEFQLDQSFDENAVAQATITIDNIAMVEQTGVSGLYHLIQRGYYAPFRGFKPPNRPKVEQKNDWFDLLHDKSTQIIVVAGYGDALVPVFLGLVNDVDMTSQPDQIVLRCRDMAQYLTDQQCFINAKARHVPDPITFADRKHAENTESVGHGAEASSHDPHHPPRFVLDSRNKTEWISQGHPHRDAMEWIEISVPGGRYDNISVNPRFAGMEMYVAVYPRDHGAPGGHGAQRRFTDPLPHGWVDEGRGTVPGTNVPYVKHVARLKEKRTSIQFPEFGYLLGDNSRIRLYFTHLDYGLHTNRHQRDYRAGVTEFRAIRRRTKKEAKRQKWILVDDLADVAKTVFQWAGINEWEVESTGVRLKDKAVFNRSNFLIDIINNAAEQVGYVFYMKPPDVFDEDDLGPENETNLTTGIGVFRQNQAMRREPLESIELVHEDMVLRGIDAKLTDEPLAYNIRVRGKEATKKKGGVRLGGDDTRRYMYVYRPPWSRDRKTRGIGGPDYGNSNQWRNANLKRYVVHHDERLRSIEDCKIASLFIAFREALESAKVQIEAPCMPTVFLDHQTALFDTGTGLSTRFWVALRGMRYTGGEDGAFVMTLGGSLLDIPDTITVRDELVRALNDNNYFPGLSKTAREHYGRIYRNT